MSNTKRDPLLSDKDINDPKLVIPLGAKMIRDIYEAARAKDAELIQQLVDALANLRHIYEFREPLTGMDELEAAAAAGFKPTEP
jgi:hypothetical protein